MAKRRFIPANAESEDHATCPVGPGAFTRAPAQSNGRKVGEAV